MACNRLLIIGFVFLFSCNDTKRQPLPIIDLANAAHETIPMSKLFETVEYVPLELTPECPLDENISVYLTDKYIITVKFSNQSAYLFDRKSGKFIRPIAQRGNGPGEYRNIISSNAFNEQDQILYFDNVNTWMGIQIETNEISTIRKPYHIDSTQHENSLLSVSNFAKLSQNEYFGFVNNITGSDPIRLVVFNQDGTILKTFPNYQTYEDTAPEMYFTTGAQYYQYQGAAYFKEIIYNDTIFRVTPGSISPHIAFSLGDKHLPYQLMESPFSEKLNYYQISFVGECDRYILFTYHYQKGTYYGYYDKTNYDAFVCVENKETANSFVNDVDNFLYFIPRFVNAKGEFSGLLSAEKVAEFVSENKTTSPGLQHLSAVKEEDNPIVVIGIPKK